MRRFLSLLIALTIAFALPPFGAATPTPPGKAAAAGCSCPSADRGCDEDGELGCISALACAVQCGSAAPMLGSEGGTMPAAPIAAVHQMGPAVPLVSAVAAPPFRPPRLSIRT